MWLTPLDGLSLGGSLQLLRLDIKLRADDLTSAALIAAGLVPADFDGNVLLRVPATLGVGSIEYSAHDLLLAAEFSRWRLTTEVRPKGAAGPDPHQTQTRWYVMASYRVTPWFTPGVYYSVMDLGQPEPQTRANYHQDAAVTFRYDLTANWIAKLEGHYMRGTGGLNPSLNSGRPLAELTRTWGVGLVKTTVFF
jgi:predicted porin